MGCLGTKPSKPDPFTSIGEKNFTNGYLNGNGGAKTRPSIDQTQQQMQQQLLKHQERLNNTQIKIAIENRRKDDVPSSDSGTGSATSNNLNFINPSNGNNTTKTKNAYVAIFDYVARTNEDLSFKKGDILYINDEDKLSNGWWWGRLKSMDGNSSQQKLSGYIPSQYVAGIDSLESQPWYFGATKRMEAEKLLMLDANSHGSFLIRISDGNNHAYSLSVRDHDSVKHYRIRLSDDGLYFYITKRVPFATLSELVCFIYFYEFIIISLLKRATPSLTTNKMGYISWRILEWGYIHLWWGISTAWAFSYCKGILF